MQPPHNPESSGRETLLTVILTGLVAGACLLFLILVTGGFFFYVVLAVAAMVGLGFFHYMVWGYGMTLEVMEEQHSDAIEPETNHEYDAPEEIMDRQNRNKPDWPGPETRIK